MYDVKDLESLLSNGIIDISSAESIIEMANRKELLDKHPYLPFKTSDGKWMVYLPDGNKGRVQRKRNTKKEIEDIIVQYQRSIESNPTIKELFEKWNNEQIENGYIKSTTGARNESFFKRHFEPLKRKRIRNVTKEIWVNFLEEQIPLFSLTAHSFGGIKTIVKGMLLKAKREKYIDYTWQDVFNELIIPKNCFKRTHKKDEEEVYTEEEMACILDHVMHNRDIWGDCIALMFITGLRIGEAIAISHDDIDPHNLCIKIHTTETREKDKEGVIRTTVGDTTKTDAGIRVVYIPRQFQHFLTSLWWRSGNTHWVFENNGKRIHSNAIRKKLARVCKKVNVPYKPPHKIRKTFCSILLDNGVDNNFVKSQMGHTSITTSEIFYHKNRANSQKRVDILSNIDEFKSIKVNQSDCQKTAYL